MVNNQNIAYGLGGLLLGLGVAYLMYREVNDLKRRTGELEYRVQTLQEHMQAFSDYAAVHENRITSLEGNMVNVVADQTQLQGLHTTLADLIRRANNQQAQPATSTPDFAAYS